MEKFQIVRIRNQDRKRISGILENYIKASDELESIWSMAKEAGYNPGFINNDEFYYTYKEEQQVCIKIEQIKEFPTL